MMRRAAIVGVTVLLGMSLCTPAGADETASTHPYSGDLLTRSTLTGDWGGARNDVEQKGITFDASLTQIEQGVPSGGWDVVRRVGLRKDPRTAVAPSGGRTGFRLRTAHSPRARKASRRPVVVSRMKK